MSVAGAICDHDKKILRCGAHRNCLKCINSYRSNSTYHLLSPLFEAQVLSTKDLMLCLTREQRSVSALIEYLDALRDKLVAHVDAKIQQVKEQIGLYSCEFNGKIRGLIAKWDEEAANEYMRHVEARERCVEVHEERLKQGIDEIIQVRGWETEEDLPENTNKPMLIMDFVDSNIGKTINIADLADIQTYHISGEYRLFPKARYCFLSPFHIVATGGRTTTGYFKDSYALHFQAGNSLSSSLRLPNMKIGRADHAICLFPQGDYQIVYVFGASDTKEISETIEFLAIKNTQIEQINTRMRRENAGNYQLDRDINCLLLEEDETDLSPHSEEKSSLEWCLATKNLPIVLNPASCVLHFRSIYITGSHPFKQFKVYQYTPQLLPCPGEKGLRDFGSVTEHEIGQRVMKQPCALAC